MCLSIFQDEDTKTELGGARNLLEKFTNNEEERGASDQLVGLTCMVGEQGGRRMTRRSFGLLQLLRVSAKETGSIQK